MITRQGWLIGSIVAGLALGTWAITRYVPPPEGVRIGQRLPEFRTLNLMHGDSVGVRNAYQGHVTLINLWATYCAPCLEEMPSIQRLYTAYHDRGFRVAAISLDDGDSEPVLAYARNLGLTFDILQDRSNISLETYQGIGLPYSILVDGNGKVISQALGRVMWDTPASRAPLVALLGSDK